MMPTTVLVAILLLVVLLDVDLAAREMRVGETVLREGDLILVPPATEHSVTNDGDSELACLSIQSPPVAAVKASSSVSPVA